MTKLDDLEQLGRLKREGLISNAEFKSRKQSLLGGNLAIAESGQPTVSRWKLVIGLLAILAGAVVMAVAALGSREGEQSQVIASEQVSTVPAGPSSNRAEGSGATDLASVRPGQDYANSRGRLIALGLRPAKISRGDEYDLCGLAHCPPFPEAISCSGTGVNECRFAFLAANGRFVIATTVGEGDNPALDRVVWASDEDAREVRNRIAGRPALVVNGEVAQSTVASGVEVTSEEAAIWKKDSRLDGTCHVEIAARVIMDGACSGAGHGDSIFVSAERDGCSVELARRGRAASGKLFPYRDTCWIDEKSGLSLDEDAALPESRFQNGCWAAKGLNICISAG